jgi:3-deoxy-7-phosphoheptulonate synthase
LQGAHVEYFKGISNPIGIKVGPKFEPDELVSLVKALNPDSEPGKVTLIHRYGDAEVADKLPRILEAITEAELNVLHTCDPMHGNTFSTNSGVKTRSFDQIASEVRQQFKIHRSQGTYLGGIHLELTGDNVTECIGGASQIGEPDLARAYKSAVDPRLNYDQAMELAFLIADELKVNQVNGNS